MIKVSHELPNNMLHMSKEINDYEYCFPHLMDDNLNLYEYMKKNKIANNSMRMSILE